MQTTPSTCDPLALTRATEDAARDPHDLDSDLSESILPGVDQILSQGTPPGEYVPANSDATTTALLQIELDPNFIDTEDTGLVGGTNLWITSKSHAQAFEGAWRKALSKIKDQRTEEDVMHRVQVSFLYFKPDGKTVDNYRSYKDDGTGMPAVAMQEIAHSLGRIDDPQYGLKGTKYGFKVPMEQDAAQRSDTEDFARSTTDKSQPFPFQDNCNAMSTQDKIASDPDPAHSDVTYCMVRNNLTDQLRDNHTGQGSSLVNTWTVPVAWSKAFEAQWLVVKSSPITEEPAERSCNVTLLCKQNHSDDAKPTSVQSAKDAGFIQMGTMKYLTRGSAEHNRKLFTRFEKGEISKPKAKKLGLDTLLGQSEPEAADGSSNVSTRDRSQ